MLVRPNHKASTLLVRLILLCAAATLSLAVANTVFGQQTSLAAAIKTTQNAPKYDIAVFKDVMVPMRDGIKLACNIYRPALNGKIVEGRFPSILERTPYSKDQVEWLTDIFIPLGYVAVRQDVRGRSNSEGTWRFFRDDRNDGYDTAKWIGEQPWSDGGIGTVGISYPGGTQHALALSNPPYLKAMIPAYATSDVELAIAQLPYGVKHVFP
jgi:uncharacterized protein